MAIDLPIRGARRFCTLRLAVAHETPRSIRTRKHSRSPACEPARHFEWNRDRHFWLSSRALVFENSGFARTFGHPQRAPCTNRERRSCSSKVLTAVFVPWRHSGKQLVPSRRRNPQRNKRSSYLCFLFRAAEKWL